jgi:NAD-dependent deacetylase
MDNNLLKAAEIIKKSKNMIALTGAGISVESGIPDFRSAGGLLDRYDPAIYASINSFIRMPERVWDMIFEMIEVTEGASPNSAHLALAKLESMNYLKCIITQNIDNLHQEAGSKNVIEYHGNAKQLVCLSCSEEYTTDEYENELAAKEVPLCKNCEKILKPSVVFFGENIPYNALTESQKFAEAADVVLVVGTSAVVYPAAAIPRTAKSRGASLIEFNLERTELSSFADILIQGSAGKTLPELIKLLEN